MAFDKHCPRLSPRNSPLERLYKPKTGLRKREEKGKGRKVGEEKKIGQRIEVEENRRRLDPKRIKYAMIK
jgi:hypothetical protein